MFQLLLLDLFQFFQVAVDDAYQSDTCMFGVMFVYVFLFELL